MLSTSQSQEARQLHNYFLNAIWLKSKCIVCFCGGRISGRMRGDEWTAGEKEQMRGLKTKSGQGESRGQVAELRWTRKGWKEHNSRDERLPENWKRLKRDKRWAEEGVSDERREHGESMKKPNKSKKEGGGGGRNKERSRRAGKIEARETFAGSLSVNHNLLGVGYERESAILQWLSLSSPL